MKIIASNNRTKVVEFSEGDTLKRRVLPVDSDTVELGIPYGLPFAEILKKSISPDLAIQVEKSLHNSGIWDIEDLQNNPMAAIKAAKRLDIDAKKILNLIKIYGGK